MRLQQLINYLVQLTIDDPNAIAYPVFCVEGSSGVATELSSPYIATYEGKYPDGSICDWPIGTKYISIYGGN